MNSVTIKVMAVVLSAFVLLMVGSQLVYSLRDSRDTEEAILYTVDENESFKGMFVRDEKVIEYSNKGVLEFNCTDASKLSENSVIANVYENEDQIYCKKQVEKLTSLKEDYEKAQNPGTSNGVQTEVLRDRISQQYMSLVRDCDGGDYNGVYDTRKELMYLLNVNNILTRNTVDFSKEIADLDKQIADYQSKCVEPVDRVIANGSGYFASKLDGYEGMVSLKDIDNLTYERASALFSAEPKTVDNAIGKIIDGYDAKLIGIIDKTTKLIELNLMTSNSLSVRFSSSDRVYNMSVDSIRPLNEDESKYLIVLNCSQLDKTLLQNRFENVELIFDEYTGIKVPRDAISFKDNVKGVYTILGQEITFKKIDVVYEGDDYVLTSTATDKDHLELYDQILVEGVEKDDG